MRRRGGVSPRELFNVATEPCDPALREPWERRPADLQNQRHLTHTCTRTEGAANDKAAHDAPDKKWWKARSKACRIIDSLDLLVRVRFVDVPSVELAAEAVARTS